MKNKLFMVAVMVAIGFGTNAYSSTKATCKYDPAGVSYVCKSKKSNGKLEWVNPTWTAEADWENSDSCDPSSRIRGSSYSFKESCTKNFEKTLYEMD